MVKLTDEQQQSVRKWINDGCNLSEIQKNLSEQFKISATYMDVRFLVIDLGLEVKEKRFAPSPVIAPGSGPGMGGRVPEEALEDNPQPMAPAGVAIELDRIMRPGSLVSGTVRFSDGVKATWTLDQTGRLAIDAGQPGYKPATKDIQAFQLELRRELEKHGF